MSSGRLLMDEGIRDAVCNEAEAVAQNNSFRATRISYCTVNVAGVVVTVPFVPVTMHV